MKPSFLILPLAVALAVGTASADDNKARGQHDGERASELAKRLIEKHDSNNDGALNEAELTEALKAMREHRMKHRKPGQGNDRPDKPKRRKNKPADNAE